MSFRIEPEEPVVLPSAYRRAAELADEEAAGLDPDDPRVADLAEEAAAYRRLADRLEAT